MKSESGVLHSDTGVGLKQCCFLQDFVLILPFCFHIFDDPSSRVYVISLGRISGFSIVLIIVKFFLFLGCMLLSPDSLQYLYFLPPLFKVYLLQFWLQSYSSPVWLKEGAEGLVVVEIHRSLSSVTEDRSSLSDLIAE